MYRLLVGGVALACAACSASPASLEIDVTTGKEKGALSADPAVTEVTITATPVDTTSSTLTAKAKPGGSFDLGDVDSTEPYTFDVTGATAAGEIVVQGRSLAIAPDQIQGAFPVFCQRVDAWARPPGGLVATHVGGMAAIASEQFLFLAGGSKVENADGSKADGTQSDFYDLAALTGTTGADLLPFVPKTVVGLVDYALLIADSATLLSFADGSLSSPTKPSGLESFGDLAGGSPFLVPDGRTFVLGATRATSPTAAVLAIGTDLSLGAFALSHPRAGAAAGWVDGVGLIVAGGSRDADAPGVELLPDGNSEFVTRPFASDRTTGAAIGTNSSGVFVIGGVIGGANAPTRRIDPGCTSSCEATAIPALALPVAIVGTQVFQLAGERLLVVGSEADGGHARTFELDVGKKVVTEIKLREPRTGASFTAAPNGTLAVLGGLHDDGTPAVSVETLFPR